jgi:hypothetical protein
MLPIRSRFSKIPLHPPAYCPPGLKVSTNHRYPAGTGSAAIDALKQTER